MTKQIVIEISDDKYATYPQVVGEIVGAATFLEAVIEIQGV